MTGQTNGKSSNFSSNGLLLGYAWDGKTYQDAEKQIPQRWPYANSAKNCILKGCTFNNCDFYIVDNKTSDIDEFETILNYLYSSTLNNCTITLSAVYSYGTPVLDEIIEKYKQLPGVISVKKN